MESMSYRQARESSKKKESRRREVFPLDEIKSCGWDQRLINTKTKQ